MNNKKIMFVIRLVVVTIMGGAYMATTASVHQPSSTTTINQASANGNGSCLPSSVVAAGLSFPAKQASASSLPAGYKLQAVDNAGQVATLFYADHSLCPLQGGLSGQIANGTIVVQIAYSKDLVNGTQIVNQEAANVKASTNGAAQPKLFRVNGHAAVGWEQYMGKDRVMMNGTTVSEEPLPMPAAVSFVDESGHTEYYIAGMKPLADLQNIANNLQG
jgi:hypothetical protein